MTQSGPSIRVNPDAPERDGTAPFAAVLASSLSEIRSSSLGAAERVNINGNYLIIAAETLQLAVLNASRDPYDGDAQIEVVNARNALTMVTTEVIVDLLGPDAPREVIEVIEALAIARVSTRAWVGNLIQQADGVLVDQEDEDPFVKSALVSQLAKEEAEAKYFGAESPTYRADHGDSNAVDALREGHGNHGVSGATHSTQDRDTIDALKKSVGVGPSDARRKTGENSGRTTRFKPQGFA